MKKTSYFFAFCAVFAGISGAIAGGRNTMFRTEMLKGLKSERDYSTPTKVRKDTINKHSAYGEMGEEVYYDAKSAQDINSEGYSLFIPTTMYVRMGGGLNLGAATKKARIGNETYHSKDSWNVLVGLGWNMSSYVRTEFAFQETTLRFSDLPDLHANYNTLNAMLYFDFARRYVHVGDMTYRRTIVPFMGIGTGIGEYKFDGINGAGGFVFSVPRLELGVNFMFNNMVGLDLAYQYQAMFGHGFGWNTQRIGVDGISNIMATIRVNF